MEAADFDELLLPVDDVPKLVFGRAVADVAGVIEAVSVEGSFVGFGVLEISWDYSWSSDADLTFYVVGADVLAVLVYESICGDQSGRAPYCLSSQRQQSGISV